MISQWSLKPDEFHIEAGSLNSVAMPCKSIDWFLHDGNFGV